MPIVSISLSEQILNQVDKLKEAGYAGRSEVIRAGLRSLLAEAKEKTVLKGKVNGVLLAVHDDRDTSEATIIRHRYEGIIKTHIHNQLENHKCLEIFVVSGDAMQVRKLADDLQTNKKIEFSKLVVS